MPVQQSMSASAEIASQYGDTFVDFTTGLVDGVVQTLVTSSIDQMSAYADLVSSISDGLQAFQETSTGLDLSSSPGSETHNDSVLDSYIANVLGVDTTADPVNLSTDLTFMPNQESVSSHFAGILVNDESFTDVYTTDPNGNITITLAKLRDFAKAKLLSGIENTYNMLLTLVREGWSKVLADKWSIETDLVFSFSASDRSSAYANTYSKKSKDWYAGGSLKTGKKINKWVNVSAWGGASGSSLSVARTSASSSSQVDASALMKGHVRIDGIVVQYESKQIEKAA